jgi:DNA repair protein SbcD/Mre11
VNSFKFLHAADVHLDSPLRGLSRYEGVPVDRVRGATREALQNLVEAALREQVAFVIIAGDLYDGDWDDFSTGLYFCSAMGRLKRAGIKVVLLYGNHDAESVITRSLPWPDNVARFDTRKAETILLDDVRTALHGRGFQDRQTRENLAATYPPPKAGWFNIGVLHTALTGEEGHESYAPCSLEELAAKNYDYWALGHVHVHRVLARNPHIVFCGNLQGRNIRETGPKGAVLVTVEGGAIADTKHLSLDVVRWSLLDIVASNLGSIEDLNQRIRGEFVQALQEADGRALMVRVVIRGATGLHAELMRREHTLRASLQGTANGLSNEIWIEKVCLQTSAARNTRSGAGALASDLEQMLQEEFRSGQLEAEVKPYLDEFLHKLPPGIGEAGSTLDRLRAGELDGFLQDSMTALLCRLSDEAV